MASVPVIPGYNIECELGQGGMARVYLAHEEKLDRPVALKVLLPSLAETPHAAERFLKEARTAGKLRHNGIITVYDVGRHNDTYYMAVEYLEGGSLKDVIQKGPLAPKQALAILSEVSSALGYAHGKGFIHRDIKPDNILFREGGEPVLTDFGIAKAVDSATKLTKTGMSIGTPHYMSPEQARGQVVDARSDLYSLGIVLYEMLIGKVPYDAEDSVAVVIQHIQQPVPKLTDNFGASRFVPAGMARFQLLIEKMLAKDPKERVQSGAELRRLIQELSAAGVDIGEMDRQKAIAPKLLTPTSGGSRPWRHGSVQPQTGAKTDPTVVNALSKLVFGMAAMLAVLLAALFLIFGNSGKREVDQPAVYSSQELISAPESARKEPKPVDKSEQEYQMYFFQARASYESGALEKALRQLALARSIKSTPEVSDLEKLVRTEIERVSSTQAVAQAEKKHIDQSQESKNSNNEVPRTHRLASSKSLEKSNKQKNELEGETSYKTKQQRGAQLAKKGDENRKTEISQLDSDKLKIIEPENDVAVNTLLILEIRVELARDRMGRRGVGVLKVFRDHFIIKMYDEEKVEWEQVRGIKEKRMNFKYGARIEIELDDFDYIIMPIATDRKELVAKMTQLWNQHRIP